MSVAARIPSDACELCYQVRHDDEQNEPHETIHCRDDDLQVQEHKIEALQIW